MFPHAFLDRPRTRVRTSAGGIELPVIYSDASAVFAFFRLEHRRAVEVLDPTPLVPARFAGDAAIAAVAAYDYRDSSIGPYRELGVGLAVLLEREVEGTIEVRCIVTAQGRVRDCRIVKSLPFMDRAVIDALERRIYEPATLGGRAIDVYYRFKIPLRLSE